jgi:cardiolipin synthase
MWLETRRIRTHWRDLMFKVTGPMARSLQTAFVDLWVSSTGELLLDPRQYPVPAPAVAPGVERFVHLASSPADDDQSMAYFYLLPILAAKESVYIATPYFIPDRPLEDALAAKARAGLDVRLLLPGHHIDNVIVRASAQARYHGLLEAGVKIYEYQPTFMHGKYAVIDRQWSIVGSPNLNFRSRELDEENAFGIFDAPLASHLQAIFLEDLERSKAMNLDAWRRRNPLQKFSETASRLLYQQS